jgi:hypothetical protein
MMRHADFRIGLEFMAATGRWRCTDVGTRTVIAIKRVRADPPPVGHDLGDSVGRDTDRFRQPVLRKPILLEELLAEHLPRRHRRELIVRHEQAPQ